MLHQVTERPGRESMSQALGNCLAISGAVVALDWAIVAAAYVASGGAVFKHLLPAHLALAFLALPFLIVNANLPYALYAAGALRLANLAQLIGAACSVAATALLVAVFRQGVGGALVAFVAGSATAAALYVTFARREAPELRFDWRAARDMVMRSGQLHLNAVGTYLFTQTSVLILNHFRPLAESAYYQLAAQLFTLSLLVSSSIGTVTYGLVAKQGPDAAWLQQRRLVLHGTAIMAGVAAIAFLAAPWAVMLVAGAAFLPAVPLFRLMLPATIGGTLSALMASQWIGRGLFWQAAAITFAIGVVSVAFALVLIPRRGMWGAVVSTLVTYGLSAAVNLAMALWIERRVTPRVA